MKYKYLILTAAGLLLFTSTTVFAEDATPSATSTEHSASANVNSFFNINDINNFFKEASNSATKQQDKLANIIKGADEMIANRITSLNNLLSRVNGDDRLTADEKTSLTTDVNNAITGLNTLKTKIDADTDPTTARSDAKQIVTNYYVYVELEPKIRYLVTLNNLQEVVTNIQNLIPQIQSLVTTLQSQGKDTSDISTNLNDISTQLTAINTTITADITTVQGVSVTTSNPQTVFSGVKNDIQTIVQTDFAKIKSDFSQIRTDFKNLIVGSGEPSATPEATPTITPTATP